MISSPDEHGPAQKKLFSVEVLTPSGPVLKADTHSVVFPAVDGEMGVLAHRAPMVSLVGAGRLTIESGERPRDFFIAGGYVHVANNVMVVLAEECIPAEDFDPERAWKAFEEARKMPADTEAKAVARQRAIDAGRLRFRMAQARQGTPRK